MMNPENWEINFNRDPMEVWFAFLSSRDIDPGIGARSDILILS